MHIYKLACTKMYIHKHTHDYTLTYTHMYKLIFLEFEDVAW